MRPFRPAMKKWHQNQALAALLFLYTHVLSIPLNRLADFTRAKRPVRIPVVATPRQVAAVLGRLEGAPALMAALLYGAGGSATDGWRVGVGRCKRTAAAAR
jgi:hypothetical protein